MKFRCLLIVFFLICGLNKITAKSIPSNKPTDDHLQTSRLNKFESRPELDNGHTESRPDDILDLTIDSFLDGLQSMEAILSHVSNFVQILKHLF